MSVRHPLAGDCPLDGHAKGLPPSSNGVDAPSLVERFINLQPSERGRPLSEVIREGAARVGVDLAKRVIQVHAVGLRLILQHRSGYDT